MHPARGSTRGWQGGFAETAAFRRTGWSLITLACNLERVPKLVGGEHRIAAVS